MAMTLLELAKSRRIETVERSLEGENIIARSAIESGTLLTRWNLQGLLFLVGHESQNELQSSVFRHFDSIVVQHSPFSYPFRHPETYRAVIVSGLQDEGYQTINC